MSNTSKASDADRRKSGRTPTSRSAVYSIAASGEPPRPAAVHNVGPLGLALEISHPLEPGTPLEIEVGARHDDESGRPMAVRGRTRHITPAGDDRWIVGVQMYVGIHRADVTGPPDIAALRTALIALDASAAARLVPDFGDYSDTVDDSEDEPSRRRYAWLLLLLLLLLIAVTLPRLLQRNATARAPESGLDRAAFELDGGTPLPQSTPKPEVPLSPRALAALAIDDGWGLLNAGMPEAALQRYDTLRSLIPLSPVEAFEAGLGEAAALHRLGREDDAAEIAERLSSAGDDVPQVWRQRADLLRKALEAPGDEPAPIPLPIATLESQPPVPSPPATATPEVVVSVDASEHVMRVSRGDETLAEFPVGLGAAGSTPQGQFVIANKIEKPDWYDRGRSVPYGDPENPLGDHWMGLTGQGGPQGIGMHATREPGSIGANESRGCIRLFPEDAARLFELVPVGGTVEIVP
ncbi:MAG: L,D-transpeptidase family protein [Candidatus Hydrogenedens sp.]|nr:L,D-transpeptidase family protein [Candidatus Hydrogenedens sp.]